MKKLLIALAFITPVTELSAQTSPNAQPSPAARVDQLPRHLVMITRAGPNFSKLSEYRDEVRAHQALWNRLAAEGHTIAGGPFEGQPVMGMTIFERGIDLASARELIKDDQFPKLGITEIEFRTLIVANGSFAAR